MPNFKMNRSKLNIIIICGIILIAALNFISFFYLQSFKKELTRNLKQQMKSSAEISARLFNGNDLAQISPGDEFNPMVRYYQQLLFELKQENSYENIIVLDLTGKLLLDFRIDYTIGDTTFTFPLNNNDFRQTILGNHPEPILNKFEGQYFLSAYTPISNDLLEPTAVLIIDAPLRFFSTLQKFETGTFYLGAVGLFILLVFSAITFFSTTRFIRIEREAKENEHLMELGQMAASVAHEIRNPLSIMKGTADILKKKYGSDGNELFNFIPEEINRLNRLVEDFLGFARRNQVKKIPINLEKLIRELTPEGNVILDVAVNLPKFISDPDFIRQIYLNILRNAQEAVTDGGKITVSLKATGRNRRQTSLTITDSGEGIPPDQLSKVFDPFFTTKSTGSGLGLAITRQLTEQLGGRMSLKSEPGKGTTVQIIF